MSKYDMLTNAELKIKLVEHENEYETLQNKISSLIKEMQTINEEYIIINNLYQKRTKGKI